MAKEDEIKLLAYKIWEQEGCINGKDCEHWFRAEAIWEEQNKKDAVKSAKIESKERVNQGNKFKAAKKKSQKT